MRSHKITMGITIALTACFLSLIQACAGKPGEARDANAAEKGTEGKVVLTADAARTAGIKTETARVRPFYPVVKASGTVVINLKKYVKVTPRVPGRIEKLFAFEGDHVRAGQDLLWLWSPELLAVQAEYLQILARVPSEGRSAVSQDEKLHESLLQSTGSKLKNLGFNEDDLAALRKNRQALPVLTVRAPISGTVVEADSAVGTAAETGTCLCAIADLTSLWVLVNIFEVDLASVDVGARTELTVAAFPGQIFQGTLSLVGAFMDEATRTVKGRVETANAAGKLRPGMYGEVRIIARDPVMMLAVPEQAVRSIAGKNVVFLPGDGGSFVRRDIRVGRTVEGFVEVLDGLKEGERVVTEGSFDVKAEMLKGTLEGEK